MWCVQYCCSVTVKCFCIQQQPKYRFYWIAAPIDFLVSVLCCELALIMFLESPVTRNNILEHMTDQVEMLLFPIAGRKGSPQTPSFFSHRHTLRSELETSNILFDVSWMHLLRGSSFRLDSFSCVLYGWLITVSCINVLNAGTRTFLPGNVGPRTIKSCFFTSCPYLLWCQV